MGAESVAELARILAEIRAGNDSTDLRDQLIDLRLSGNPEEDALLMKIGATRGWGRVVGQIRGAVKKPEPKEKGSAKSSARKPPAPQGRPRIVVSGADPRDVIRAAWRVLNDGDDEARLYQQEGRVVKVRRSDAGACIVQCGANQIRAMLNDEAQWAEIVKRDGETVEKLIPPPQWIGEMMAAAPDPGLPTLIGIASSPYLSPDRKIVYQRGYNARSRMILLEEWRDLPRYTVEEAVAVLQEWLVDFKFARDSDRCNALALFLLPFVRPAVEGPTPGHMIEAASPGSGKSLLAQVLMLPSLGVKVKASPFADSEEERRKALAAVMAAGRAAVLLDNLKGRIDSQVLEGVLTSEAWADRQLGTMAEILVPNRATWAMTSNNAEMSLDLARRCMRVRLDPGDERPYERNEWVHPDITGYTIERRRDLVGAALWLIQHWLSAGGAPPARCLNSFEAWSRIVGGVLTHAGIGGWMDDRDDLYRNADRQSEEWRVFIERWGEVHGEATVSGRQLLMLIDAVQVLQGVIGDGGDRSQMTRLGAAIGRQRGRIFGAWKVADRVYDRTGAVYQLVKVEAK